MTDIPESEKSPPHDPEYHIHFPPLPGLPPVKVSTDDESGTVPGGFATAETADVDKELTDTVILKHKVVLHELIAFTQYVQEISGRISTVVPVLTRFPLQEPVYHDQSPSLPEEPPFTERFTAEPGHTLSGEHVTESAATDKARTIMQA